MITKLRKLNEAWCDLLFSERADKFFKRALAVTLALFIGKMAIHYIVIQLWS